MDTVNPYMMELLAKCILLNCTILLFKECDQIYEVCFLIFVIMTLLFTVAKLLRKCQIKLRFPSQLRNLRIFIFARRQWLTTTSLCFFKNGSFFSLSIEDLLDYFFFAVFKIIFMKNETRILDMETLRIVDIPFIYTIEVSLNYFISIFIRVDEMSFKEIQFLLVLNIWSVVQTNLVENAKNLFN